MADKTSEPILKDALERFEESENGSEFNRTDAYDDIRFARLGDQWPRNVKKLREDEGRPCLTINKLPAFIRQVVNDSRQNKPGIKVSPVDNGADVQTAEVISGLIKSIERGSHADVAYDTAIDHAVTGGFGFFRITTDYCHPDTFYQEAKIERIPNPLMVHWDVNSTQFDASDWDYAFISDFLTEDQFKARYPKADPVSFEADARGAVAYWLMDDKIRLAEYFERISGQRKLLLLQDQNGQPMTVREDDLPKVAKAFFAAGGMDPTGGSDDEITSAFMQAKGLQQAKSRDVTFYTVKRRIISGVEVLEEHDWPGSMIPICPVWGEEVYLDGRRHFRSLIRDARDPQAMFNFWRTASTELVALAPKAPFLVPLNGIPPEQKGRWETANSRSWPYLEYDPKAGPMPERQGFASVPTGAIQEAMNASDDMKAIMGIYDPSLGAQARETSGKAILARQREADVSNFHFIDNLARAIQYAGKVLIEIIPSIYGTRETIRILGDDMKEKVVQLTQQDGGAKQPGPDGQPALYNLSVGTYDVTVSVGPSYATQRQETQDVLTEIMSRVPGAAQYIGDILLENMDFPQADKVAKRLQMLLPPAIQQAEGIQGVQPQVNPLDDEEKKAKIENLRASAMASLAKAGATQQDSRVALVEALLNALDNIHQNANDMVPNPGPVPGSPPVSPAQPPANPQGQAGY